MTGVKGAIAADNPKMEYQRCIVHQVQNTLKYVSGKDRKLFAADFKTIYQAPTEDKALESLERVTEKRSEKYPNSMKSWHQNWDAMVPIFKFSTTVRKVIYHLYRQKNYTEFLGISADKGDSPEKCRYDF